ncbi:MULTISPECIES: hypothetical protein [Tepidibacillus]|uniref:Lipoprotein n=2 Tax=Tepidibacillus TaxID=1494427 RepID=A0A135L0T2_9BACI|nr:MULTISPECIES: hypothetical protein [Tepidibacillus]KXG42572.1 hypothetical protein U473_13985 [Tepidibacillus decaturensis]TCS79558.1 hypothetical protein EDD72_12017 [Tepidibacillus fermentans]
MNKKIFIIIFLLSMGLTACSKNTFPSDIEREIEKQMDVNITIPTQENLPITFISLLLPPELDLKTTGNRYIAQVIYANEKGELISLTDEQKQQIEENNRMRILYGEYKGEKTVELNIGKGSSSLSGSENKKIGDVLVEYKLEETKRGKILFLLFNDKDVYYLMKFHLSSLFTEQDGLNFAADLINNTR